MKTIEEAAEESAFSAIGNGGHFADAQIFRYGVEFAQRWIPIEEELPNTDNGYLEERVLVKEQSGYLTMARYDIEQEEWFSDNDWLISENVTHWRPTKLK